ncbi:hypothetical protein [Plantactinospora sp. WMMB782]|uniref:hypothetical protein n=1 Tax=Plantactinospora sp. WMMB782 TaxID=3404121 RepID=UPI003B95D6B7
MSPQPSGIEVVPVTAAQIGGAFLLGVLLLAVAVGVTAWAVRGPVEPESVDDVDRRAEIRAPRVGRGLRRRPHTGTVHVPGVRPVSADDPTVVIRMGGDES